MNEETCVLEIYSKMKQHIEKRISFKAYDEVDKARTDAINDTILMKLAEIEMKINMLAEKNDLKFEF